MTEPPRADDSSELPPYPRAGADQRVRLAKEATFRAWVGRPEKLVSIARQVEDALEKIYNGEVSTLDPAWDRGRAERLAFELQMEVRVTGSRGRMERTGSLGAILAEMDTHEIETIAFGNSASDSSGLPAIEVSMRSRQVAPRRAVQVKVRGGDRQWVGGVFDLLSSELRKGVPAWAFMRAGWFALLVANMCGLGTASIILGSGDGIPDDFASGLALGLIVLIIGTWAGLIAVHPLLIHLFPGLEIVEAGGTPKGRQVLAYAVAALTIGLSVAGVVLPLL